MKLPHDKELININGEDKFAYIVEKKVGASGGKDCGVIGINKMFIGKTLKVILIEV